MTKLPIAPACHLVVAIMLILSASEIRAANHYILPSPGGKSGTTGADWAHACSEFTANCAPSAMVRGDTYYFGGGSYSAATYNFNTAASGTALITIKACVTTDPTCTASSGWNSNMGVDTSQAVLHPGGCSSGFPGCIALRFGSYFVIDGVVGDGRSSAFSSYGIYIASPTVGNGYQQHPIIFDGSNTSFMHWSAQCGGTSDDTEQELVYYSSAVSNNYLGYFYAGPCQTQLNFANGDSNWTIEYGRIALNYSTASHHGVNVNAFNTSGNVFRYVQFDGCLVTGCFEANSSTCGINNWQIYGNLMLVNASPQGVISADGASTVCNTAAYNNTIVNFFGSDFFFNNTGTGNTSENNLFYSSNCTVSNTGSGVAHDYNTYLSCNSSTPSETHGQTDSFNPFMNSAGGDYTLAKSAVSSCSSGSATCGGLSTPGTYTADFVGNIYGAYDGVWERGAYAYGPAPPTNLNAVIQ